MKKEFKNYEKHKRLFTERLIYSLIWGTIALLSVSNLFSLFDASVDVSNSIVETMNTTNNVGLMDEQDDFTFTVLFAFSGLILFLSGMGLIFGASFASENIRETIKENKLMREAKEKLVE